MFIQMISTTTTTMGGLFLSPVIILSMNPTMAWAPAPERYLALVKEALLKNVKSLKSD
jgi:hypothetical protein